jgi:hypothetical protein
LDSGLRFVANFKYNIKSKLSKEPLKEKSLAQFESLSTSDEKAFESDCDQTMVGIVQDE